MALTFDPCCGCGVDCVDEVFRDADARRASRSLRPSCQMEGAGLVCCVPAVCVVAFSFIETHFFLWC